MNNRNQTQTLSNSKKENNHLFREVEKRYNNKVNDEVLIGIENEINKIDLIKYSIRDYFKLKEELDSINIGSLPLRSYYDIYKLTMSGYYSKKNPFNIEFSTDDYYWILVPIITISRGSRDIPFRMDDKFLSSLVGTPKCVGPP